MICYDVDYGRWRRVDDERRRITTTTLLDYRAANASEMVFCRAESVGRPASRPAGARAKNPATHTRGGGGGRDFNALDETRPPSSLRQSARRISCTSDRRVEDVRDGDGDDENCTRKTKGIHRPPHAPGRAHRNTIIILILLY